MSETLTYKDSITRVGYTTIDGERVMSHTCTIDSEDPSEMSVSSSKIKPELYKANREICRADIAEFEDAAYLLQEQYIMQKAMETAESGVTE